MPGAYCRKRSDKSIRNPGVAADVRKNFASERNGTLVALALLFVVSYKVSILAMTYAVVVFSIIVQDFTMEQRVRWIITNEPSCGRSL